MAVIVIDLTPKSLAAASDHVAAQTKKMLTTDFRPSTLIIDVLNILKAPKEETCDVPASS